MSNIIFNTINSKYERLRQQSFDKLAQSQNEIYLKIPRILEIENEINKAGIKYTKQILFNNKSGYLVDELSDRLTALRQEKENLLEAFGYAKNYLEPQFKCSNCKDTGYIQNKGQTEQCFCLKQLFIELAYKHSNLKLTQIENFSSFNINFYPDLIDEAKFGLNLSPRENILKIKDFSLKFIENFDSPDTKNLFFSGPTGVGKTFMSNCIAREILLKGKTVLYQTAPILFNTINEFKLTNYNDSAYDDSAYKSIFETELLIIDDLGTETQTASRYSELLNILNTRQMNNLTKPCKTIISTNIGAKQLKDYYTERVMSRIVGNFDRLMFIGQDIRNLKN